MKQIHTAGPWEFDRPGFISVVRDDKPVLVAEVWQRSLTKPGHPIRFEEATANARLIAAAPDMLAALIGLEIDLQHSLDCGTKEFSEEWLRDNLKSIGAIVSKATQSQKGKAA